MAELLGMCLLRGIVLIPRSWSVGSVGVRYTVTFCSGLYVYHNRAKTKDTNVLQHFTSRRMTSSMRGKLMPTYRILKQFILNLSVTCLDKRNLFVFFITLHYCAAKCSHFREKSFSFVFLRMKDMEH